MLVPLPRSTMGGNMDNEDVSGGGGGSDGEVAITLAMEPEIGTRDAQGWPEWEVQRTRSFASTKEDWIDTKKLLGRYRNSKLELVMTKSGTTYAGTWTFSLDVKVGPYKIFKDGKAVLQLKNGGTVLLAVNAAGFARACGDWRTESYSGALTLDQFDAVTNVSIVGDVELKKC